MPSDAKQSAPPQPDEFALPAPEDCDADLLAEVERLTGVRRDVIRKSWDLGEHLFALVRMTGCLWCPCGCLTQIRSGCYEAWNDPALTFAIRADELLPTHPLDIQPTRDCLMRFAQWQTLIRRRLRGARNGTEVLNLPSGPLRA